MNSLLPPGSSPLERRLAQTCSGISDLQVSLRDLWNPATCPIRFLPYLAWAFSVDRWDESWTENVKRRVVQDAFYIHQHKGTISAVRRVVEPFGFLIRIIEWWQTGETPGTFRLDIGVQDHGITEDTYLELERLISDAKPCSRHMTGMSISRPAALTGLAQPATLAKKSRYIRISMKRLFPAAPHMKAGQSMLLTQ